MLEADSPHLDAFEKVLFTRTILRLQDGRCQVVQCVKWKRVHVERRLESLVTVNGPKSTQAMLLNVHRNSLNQIIDVVNMPDLSCQQSHPSQQRARFLKRWQATESKDLVERNC